MSHSSPTPEPISLAWLLGAGRNLKPAFIFGRCCTVYENAGLWGAPYDHSPRRINSVPCKCSFALQICRPGTFAWICVLPSEVTWLFAGTYQHQRATAPQIQIVNVVLACPSGGDSGQRQSCLVYCQKNPFKRELQMSCSPSVIAETPSALGPCGKGNQAAHHSCFISDPNTSKHYIPVSWYLH